MAGAAAQPSAAAALLDSLLADVAASVRPALQKEKREEETDPGLNGRPARIRREAEALLLAAERATAPAFREQHAELWPALAADLDRRLTEACYAGIYGEDYYDDDHTVLWSRLAGRPSSQAAAKVKSSLGSAFGRGAVGAGSSIMDLFKAIVPPDRLPGLHSDPNFQALAGRYSGGATSTQRPALASPLSRFDASYDTAAAAVAAGGGGSSAGAAVAEARCEVTFEELPSGGRLVASGDILAFSGGTGWKQRSPYLRAGRISGGEEQAAAAGSAAEAQKSGAKDASLGAAEEEEEEDDEEEEEEGGWQGQLRRYDTGFYDPGFALALDTERGLVWAGGGESRIKAFAIDRGGPSAACGCRYTLAGSNRVLAVADGRVLAADRAGKGALLYWEVDRLTPQRRWIGADELAGDGADSEGEEALEQQYGCKVLNMLGSSMNDDLLDNPENVEVTAGDKPHGRVQLQAAQQPVLELVAVGPPSAAGAEPQQMAAVLESSNSVWVFDWPSGRLSRLLTGLLGNPASLAACPALPHIVAAGSYDATVRVWDVRSAASTHVLTTRSSMAVGAVALAEDQGVPLCFSAQRGAEAVLAWDLRAPGRCLYELATGNTDVICLQWHTASRSLFAATECDYQDRHGGMHDQGALEGYRWPECMHRPSDFGHVWDAGDHLLVRYAFKDAPDHLLLPEEPEPDSEAEEWSSDDERRGTFERRRSPTFW